MEGVSKRIKIDQEMLNLWARTIWENAVVNVEYTTTRNEDLLHL